MVKGGEKNMKKIRASIFVVILGIIMILMNTYITTPSAGYDGKTNQGRLFGPFLLIKPEKTEIFETESLDVNVSINNPHPLLGKFYIYIIYRPSNPQNFIVDGLYGRVIGHSKLLSYSDLEHGAKVENCSFTIFQSFEKGNIRAKIVPLWLSKMPGWLRFYLNFWNCPRWSSNTENITVYNILDELGDIGVQSYNFTYINKNGNWDKWEPMDEKQNKNNFPPGNNKDSVEKSEGNVDTYKIKAGSSFNATVILFNKLNIDIDTVWVQVSLVKPSKFGVGAGEDTVAIASTGWKINKSTSGKKEFTSVNLTGYLPLNIEDGQYRTKATVYLPYTGWIPTPNSDYGDYLYVYGGIESSLISNSQLEDMKETLFMLIPTLFVLGLIFAASKKYIYKRMDEKLRRDGKPK